MLVFNCDETFDFQAMGRIFVGLCQVGAWGCFDEFNRLEERMLSAVSQQIQTIQEALKSQKEASNEGVSVGSKLFITPVLCYCLFLYQYIGIFSYIPFHLLYKFIGIF